MLKKLSLLLLISFSTQLLASEMAKELFVNKCSTCHTLKQKFNPSTVVAPPARNIMFHMDSEFKSDKERIAHINEFVLNPTMEKAICKSVRRFGLMPSQKGNITKEELNLVATWMVKNLSMSKEEHDTMKRKNHK